MKLKPLLLGGAAFAILALVTLLGTADTVRAGTFNPTIETRLNDPTAGANSGFTTTFDVGLDAEGTPNGDVNFGAAVFFFPAEWEITPGDEIPIGAVVGRLNAIATLGLINAQCDNALAVEFIMLNASIDITDTVAFEDTDEEDDIEHGDVFQDKDGTGLQEAIEKYPEFINRIIDNAQPIRRAAGMTIVGGADVLLQFLVFEPGTTLIREIPTDESLGYPTMTFLQAIGDPDAEPEPGPITDFCTPLRSVNITFGISKDNACTDAVPLDERDPVCEVSSAVHLECDNFRDDDGDQIANDGCPTVGDEPETDCEDDEDDDGDDAVNDGCPAIDEPEDSTPTEPDESGHVLFTNPEEGTYTFTAAALGLRDADGDGFENTLDTCALDPNQGDPRIKGDGDFDEDGLDAACDPNDDEINSDQDADGYLNRQDNCPLVANGEEEDNQQDSDVNEQGDPRPDGIGDACDPNPEVPDGEALFAQATSDVTIGPGAQPPDEEGEEGDGGLGTGVIILIVVIAGVVVVGGGAFLIMRRSGG